LTNQPLWALVLAGSIPWPGTRSRRSFGRRFGAAWRRTSVRADLDDFAGRMLHRPLAEAPILGGSAACGKGKGL